MVYTNGLGHVIALTLRLPVLAFEVVEGESIVELLEGEGDRG